MRGLGCGAVLLVALGVMGCKTSACPEIGCRPEIALTYRQSVVGDYALLIALRGVTYQAVCPKADAPYETSPHVSCDANGALLSGVDLGHGGNESVDLTVGLVTGDAATTHSISATLEHVTNSRDCDLVCYQHSATVDN